MASHAASRLDRFHASASLTDSVQQCHILPSAFSDHHLIVLHLCSLTPSSFGSSTPRMRANFRDSPELRSAFLAWLHSEVDADPSAADYAALLQWWPVFKQRIFNKVATLDRQQAQARSRLNPEETAAVAAALCHNLSHKGVLEIKIPA